MARRRFNQKTLWNVAVVAVLLMIMLAIGVFIGRTLTMNTPGDTAPTIGPSATPGNDHNAIMATSVVPTAAAVTLAPSPAANTATPAPSATIAPTPTPRPTPSPTPVATPTPTPRPTFTPTPSPTPTPTPTPIGTADTPFYESITTLKDKDRFSLAPVENSYLAGNGPLYLDLAHSNMGSGYAYVGDTIGIQLKIYNDGPAMNKMALVTMNISRMITTPAGSFWRDDIIPGQQFETRITVGEKASFTKNLSYAVPNAAGIGGFYRITVKFYVDGKFNAGFIKELNILE